MLAAAGHVKSLLLAAACNCWLLLADSRTRVRACSTAPGTNNPAEVVFATLLLMGLAEMLFGLLQIGRIVELVGTPAMIGFVNGLAMLIAQSQMSNFKRFDNATSSSTDPFYYEDRDSSFITGSDLGYTLLLVFCAMATMFTIPGAWAIL